MNKRTVFWRNRCQFSIKSYFFKFFYFKGVKQWFLNVLESKKQIVKFIFLCSENVLNSNFLFFLWNNIDFYMVFFDLFIAVFGSKLGGFLSSFFSEFSLFDKNVK